MCVNLCQVCSILAIYKLAMGSPSPTRANTVQHLLNWCARIALHERHSPSFVPLWCWCCRAGGGMYLYACACPALPWHCVGHLQCPVLVLPTSFAGCALVHASDNTFVQHCCCLFCAAFISAVPCLPALPWSEKGVVAGVWAFFWGGGVGGGGVFFASTPHPDFTFSVTDFCAPFLFGYNHCILTYFFFFGASPISSNLLHSHAPLFLCVCLGSG